MTTKIDKDLYKRKLILFIFISIGHPCLFLLYMYIMAKGSFGNQSYNLFGYPTFYQVSTNVYKINFPLFAIFAMAFYAMWLFIQTRIINNKEAIVKFINIKLGFSSFLISMLGYINLLVWCTIGMEGNIFGFVFALPLIMISIISVILFFLHLGKATS